MQGHHRSMLYQGQLKNQKIFLNTVAFADEDFKLFNNWKTSSLLQSSQWYILNNCMEDYNKLLIVWA